MKTLVCIERGHWNTNRAPNRNRRKECDYKLKDSSLWSRPSCLRRNLVVFGIGHELAGELLAFDGAPDFE
jgi:hypothetical protein